MKNIKDLTKEELIGVLTNLFSEVNSRTAIFECATCGNNRNAQFYYICDDCNERLTQEADYYVNP